MESHLYEPTGKCFQGMSGAYAALYTPFAADGFVKRDDARA